MRKMEQPIKIEVSSLFNLSRFLKGLNLLNLLKQIHKLK